MNFNGLTDAQEERLYLVVEECGEVVQAATKILRHGYESYHPDTGVSNRSHFQKELGDLLECIDMMKRAFDVNMQAVFVAGDEKRIRLPQWLHHQEKI